MTPDGQVVNFQYDPSVDPSELQAVQDSIQQQWRDKPKEKLPPILKSPAKTGNAPVPAAPAPSSAPASSGNILETYPALSDKIGTARQAGYSDQEIQKHIQGRIHTAIRAGYSQDEVSKYLGNVGPTTGQKIATNKYVGAAVEGIKELPSTAWEMVKGIGKAAVTQPKEGLMAFRPSALADVGKGFAKGMTAGIYQPEAKDEEQAARQTAGELAGFAVPFKYGTKALEATGLPALGAKLATGAGLGAAAPAVHGDPEGAVKGAVTGAGLVGALEAAGSLRRAPKAEVPPTQAKPTARPSPKAEARIPTAEDVTARMERSAPQAEPTPAPEAPIEQPTPEAPKAKPTATEVAAQKAQAATERKAVRLFAQDLNKRAPTAKDVETARMVWDKMPEEARAEWITRAGGKPAPKPEMAPRTPEEMAREAEQTRILREGAETQQPVGIPQGPMSPAEVEMQNRAFVKQGAPKAKPQEETVRYYRADAEGAASPNGENWVKDPEYIRAGGYGEPNLYVDVPKSFADPDNYGVIPTRIRIPVDSELARSAKQIERAAPEPLPTHTTLPDATPIPESKQYTPEKQVKAAERAQQMTTWKNRRGPQGQIGDYAERKIDELSGTQEPLEYKGKTYEGAQREPGGKLRLKDNPDKVLSKSNDILSVEKKEVEGFPWEQPGYEPPRRPVPDSELSPEEIAARDEMRQMLGGIRKPPRYEKTPAGDQAVIAGMPERKIAKTGTRAKVAQAEEPTELEMATKPKPPSDTTLFGGIPLPAMKQFVSDFVVTPLSKFRQAARTIYSPRSVSEEAGEAQRLLTKRTSRIEENERFITEQFRHAKAFMDTKPAGEQLDFWHALETGQKLESPIEQKIAESLRAALDVNRTELSNRDLLKSIIDNYMPHQFDRPELAQQVMAQMEARRGVGMQNLKGPSYFLKQRTIPGTVKEILESPEGQAAGLKLRYPNPVVATERVIFDSARLIHGYDLMRKELQPKGLVKLFRDPRMVPPDWKEVEGYKPPRRPIRDLDRPEAPAVYVENGRYYAPDPVARVLNNYTRPGLMATDRAYVPALRAYRELTGLTNLLNLSVSGFHAFTTATNNLGAEFARGIMSLKEGRPGEALKRFAFGSSYFGPVIRDIRLGKQLEKIANDPKMDVHYPAMSKVIRQYVDSGGRIDNSRPFFSRYVDDYLKALEDRSIVEGGNGAMAKTLRIIGTGGTEGIMKHIVAPVKIASFANRLNDFVSTHPGLTEGELLKYSSEIMNQVDDAFGLVNYDRWGLDRHIRDSLFLTLRAPGWTVGNMKILFGGMEDMAKGKITERSARLAGDLMALTFTGALINLAFAGKLPDVDVRKPIESIYNLMNPEDGGVNPDGTPSRIGFAGIQRDWGHLFLNVLRPAMQGDPQAAITGAAKFAIGKENPLLGIGTKFATGKDYFGRDIVDRSKSGLGQMGDLAVGMGKEMLPFTATNLMSEKKRGIDRPWWQSGFLAMTPPMSTKAIESKFMRLLSEKTQYGSSPSQAQEEHVQFKKELFEKLAKKENVHDMLTSGKITATDIKEGMKRLNLMRRPEGQLQYALARPGVSLATLSELAPTATAEEAPFIMATITKKYMNAVNSGHLTKKVAEQYQKAKDVLKGKMKDREAPLPNVLEPEPQL